MLETYVLHITKECNLNCVYCYEKDKTSVYTWKEIKNLLDDIVAHNKNFNLEFLGGEPCLRIDLIIQTVHYLKSLKGVSVNSFIITTNGTIINTDLIALLKSNSNVTWAASIDGNEFMNIMRMDKSGKNSYQRVIDNFKILKGELNGDKNQQLMCHLVTHPYNIGYFNDGVTDLYNQGFRYFAIGTVESTIIIDDEYCEEFIRQHKILSDRIHKGELPGISVGLFNDMKPRTDERYYIKDKTGKTILETYGRVSDDIKDTEEYKSYPSTSKIGNKIVDIREAVYKYHNNVI